MIAGLLRMTLMGDKYVARMERSEIRESREFPRDPALRACTRAALDVSTIYAWIYNASSDIDPRFADCLKLLLALQLNALFARIFSDNRTLVSSYFINRTSHR